MNSYGKLIVNEIAEHRETKPSWRRKEEFAQWCYGDWALEQLLDIVTENSTCPILIRVGEFINQMDEFSCINRAFSPAYDMAVYILDLCITESERSCNNEVTEH